MCEVLTSCGREIYFCGLKLQSMFSQNDTLRYTPKLIHNKVQHTCHVGILYLDKYVLYILCVSL